MNYTIFATLGNDLEKIIDLDFLDNEDLKTVEEILVPLFKRCDYFDAMSEDQQYEYEIKNGARDLPYPYFVFDNVKHKDLIAYLTLANIGIRLNYSDLPDAFKRSDTINLSESN